MLSRIIRPVIFSGAISVPIRPEMGRGKKSLKIGCRYSWANREVSYHSPM